MTVGLVSSSADDNKVVIFLIKTERLLSETSLFGNLADQLFAASNPKFVFLSLIGLFIIRNDQHTHWQKASEALFCLTNVAIVDSELVDAESSHVDKFFFSKEQCTFAPSGKNRETG